MCGVLSWVAAVVVSCKMADLNLLLFFSLSHCGLECGAEEIYFFSCNMD